MISSNYFGNLTSSILQITILNPKKKTESKKMLDSDFSGLITEIALIGQSINFFGNDVKPNYVFSAFQYI